MQRRLFEIVDIQGSHFVHNECDTVLIKEHALLILETESCEATCPHRGKVNHIEGFTEVLAFRCRFCGEGVGP